MQESENKTPAEEKDGKESKRARRASSDSPKDKVIHDTPPVEEEEIFGDEGEIPLRRTKKKSNVDTAEKNKKPNKTSYIFYGL